MLATSQSCCLTTLKFSISADHTRSSRSPAKGARETSTRCVDESSQTSASQLHLPRLRACVMLLLRTMGFQNLRWSSRVDDQSAATGRLNAVMESGTKLGNTLLLCEHKVWRAVLHKDHAALAALFSDDYIEITLDGKRVLKAAVVNESPEADDIKEYTIDSEQVVTLSDESMLLSYHLWLSGTCRGVPIIPRDRWVTSVWTRKHGCWQCSLFQQSRFVRPQLTEDCGDTNLGRKETIQIVPMTSEHVPAAIDLWHVTEGLILTYSDNAADLARYFDDNPQMSHVALQDGRLVGAVLCGHDGRRGYLHHLAVAGECRSKGIGRALVDACLSKTNRNRNPTVQPLCRREPLGWKTFLGSEWLDGMVKHPSDV